MGIYEERVLPVRLICESHFPSQLLLLLLTHSCQRLLVLLVQVVVVQAERNNHETQR